MFQQGLASSPPNLGAPSGLALTLSAHFLSGCSRRGAQGGNPLTPREDQGLFQPHRSPQCPRSLQCWDWHPGPMSPDPPTRCSGFKAPSPALAQEAGLGNSVTSARRPHPGPGNLWRRVLGHGGSEPECPWVPLLVGVFWAPGLSPAPGQQAECPWSGTFRVAGSEFV